MSEHTHGEMNTDVQENTFNGFVKATTYSCVAIILFLIFLAIVGG
ncbi:Cytochrome c oxidase subunit 4 [Roseovarius albus]|uniref:Cytochrome c oxidase subunit 4 n=1 Tax=Roseovarius albus TaxID=1247867 RepID=A0A1X6ZZL8_9RHOB|nr:aa3-type cytochrome c oxidase subunit IV [Roseovarius albus]SLN66155.1 Cytochrome c oxidase subunit 4 [Roseovarius albus]